MLWRSFLCYLVAMACLLPAACAEAMVVTQRCINQWAAAADDVRHAIVVDTGLRLPGEQLDAYLRRIALPLPNETPQAYQKRITAYFTAFQKANAHLSQIRELPTLQARTSTNLRIWQQIVLDAHSAPRQLHFLQIDWTRRNRAQGRLHFALQFDATTNLYIALYNLLRDALP
ncbi:hypothetical protein [Chthonomonas calidirosea]|nr:hypothetical protein [Chthonomonas calidirosea]